MCHVGKLGLELGCCVSMELKSDPGALAIHRRGASHGGTGRSGGRSGIVPQRCRIVEYRPSEAQLALGHGVTNSRIGAVPLSPPLSPNFPLSPNWGCPSFPPPFSIGAVPLSIGAVPLSPEDRGLSRLGRAVTTVVLVPVLMFTMAIVVLRIRGSY